MRRLISYAIVGASVGTVAAIVGNAMMPRQNYCYASARFLASLPPSARQVPRLSTVFQGHRASALKPNPTFTRRCPVPRHEQFGYANAAAWVMGAILVGFTLIQIRNLTRMRFSTAKL